MSGQVAPATPDRRLRRPGIIMYKRTLVKSPKLYIKPDKGVDNKTLYGVLCCMRFLCRESETGGSEDWGSFVNALEDLLHEYSDCVKPSGIGCIEHGWKEKLLDREPLKELWENRNY